MTDMMDTPAGPELLVATPVTVPPFILVKPYIAIGPTGTEVTIECASNQVDASVDQDENTVETFCGTYTNYKAEVWTVTITALQSYGAAGLWNLLRPLCNTVQPFELRPNTAVAGPGNPSMKGSAYVKGFPFLSAAVGEASEFDLVLAVQGTPTFATA